MRAPPWTKQEKAILANFFEAEGARGCMERMPSLEERGGASVRAMAYKMRLQSPLPPNSLIRMLSAEQVDQLVRLHDEEGIGFRLIGQRFGIAEGSAANAYYREMCVRRGFTPARRNEHGHLLPEEIERLRDYLRRGTKPKDIQLFMGISAGAICNERRQYNAELKARGKKRLPPPGGGERYSGAKVAPEIRRQVEQLYLEGAATPKVSKATGISKTHCLRTRLRLVKRLKRKGECLPGCDIDGRRLHHDTPVKIPPRQKELLRQLLLQRWPVRAAAIETGIGGKSAYGIRDELAAELEAKGEQLPAPILPGRAKRPGPWLPPQRRWWVLYRRLEAEHGHDEAKRQLVAGMRAIAEIPAAIRRAILIERRSRPMTFEEQLEAVRRGRGIVARFTPRKPPPDMTLGGIATGLI